MSVIIVRNDDASITYVGNWTTVQAATVNNIVSPINGPVFSPTLHSTTAISSFTFPYHGSSINVVGTINVANSSTNPDPTWQCFVDGNKLDLPSSIPPINNRNIESLCNQGNIPDGAHELVVNVTSRGMPFYLDTIQYQPSSNVSRENSFIEIGNDDPAVDFISGWSPLDIRNGTTDPNGLVNVTFVGIQLSWYGFIPIEEPHDASSGEYSIDGQPFIPFQLMGLPQSFSATAFNQLFFKTPTLEMGAHTLSAKYTGSPGQTPFTFEYLIVTNGSFSSSPTSTSSGSVSGIPTSIGPSSTTNDTRKNPSHVGSIIGGVVGGVGGIAVCSIIFLFWLRSRRWKNRSRRSVIEPFIAQPQFVYQAAPPSTSSQTTKSRGTTYTHHLTQPSMSQFSNTASSSNISTLPYTTDETGVGSRGPLPASPPRFIPPLSPVGRTVALAPIQHEDSGIRLSRPVLGQIVVEIPPTYSEQ